MTDYKKLNLVEGWNLVSSFDLNVNLDDIKKPNGLTIQAVYEYNSGYNSVNELVSGKGYWMKADKAGDIFIPKTYFTDKHDLLTITAFYPQLTHYDQTLKTTNAFLYLNDDKRYLVTTAHLLFDSWKSTDSEMPNLIKCRKQTLNKYWYSRFFDVAVFDVSDLSEFDNLNGFISISNVVPESVHVSYIDPNADNIIKVESKYTNLVSSHIEMGAVGHKLISGSSGSAVTDINGDLVSMITSCGELYDNITLTIPVSTISKIVKTGSINNPNYDINNKIYPGLLTQPLQRGHLEVVNVNNGEVVLQSNNSEILPFDIVTHVNGNKVGKDNKLSSFALENQDKLDLTIHKLKSELRDVYGALPRNVPIYNEDGDNYIEETKYLEKDQFLITGNKIDVKGNVKLEYIYPGMNIKLYDENYKISFATIMEVNKDTNSVTVNKINSNISGIYFYYLSSIYSEQANDDVKGIEYFNWSTVNNNKMTNEEYKFYCQYVSIKYWAFLVLSSISILPVGHQQIVWANEINRILKLLDNFSDELEILCSIILFKLMEFNEIQALNLFVIFVKNLIFWFELDDEDVVELEKSLIKNISLLKNMEFISTSFKDSILDNGKKLTEGYDGNTLYNVDVYSNEKYNLQNTVAKAKSRVIAQDNVNLEIELVLKELEKLDGKTFNDDELYYPPFYGLLQSFWDHSHMTLAGIMSTLTDDSFETKNKIVTMSKLPDHLSSWYYELINNRGTRGGCWICTYLHRKGLLSDQEYEKFNKFGLYAFKHHGKTMKGYWSYLNSLMEHFSSVAEEEEWNHFTPWAKETLELIDNGQMEDAYVNFCKEVVYLTENYNKDYQLFDDVQMDVYLGVFNMFN